MPSSKAELKVSREVAVAIKELSLLRGVEEDEFVRELLETYVKAKHGVEELERYTLADLLVMMNALVRILTVAKPVLDMYMSLAVPAYQLPPQQQQQESAEGGEEERLVAELRELREAFSKSLEELRMEMREAVLEKRGEERGNGASAALSEVDEIRQEFMVMFLNYMRHEMGKMFNAMFAQQKR
ncbi:hypothetical protein [Pyrobaculum sp.]|uniref:hypothetical protein n=1 Tax=Pyrobaculum sp. TaxID=2004705 RepID=UPI003D12B523